MLESGANIVSDDEKVARVIFSPSYLYNGRVAPTAFRWEILPSGDAEDYISVLRCNTENTALMRIMLRHGDSIPGRNKLL